MKFYLPLFLWLPVQAIDLCSPTVVLSPEEVQRQWEQAGLEIEVIRKESNVHMKKMLVQRRIDMYYRCKKPRYSYRFPGLDYLWNLERSRSPKLL